MCVSSSSGSVAGVSRTPFLTLLVPAYNEARGLTASVETLLAALESYEISCEVLIVNDASTDDTGVLADMLALRYPQVSVIHHSTNQGIGGGFVSGVAAARGEWFILIPADLAMDLAELQRYFAAVATADVLVGIRSNRSDYSGWRRIVSFVNIGLIQLLFGMRERQFNYITMYRLAVLRAITVEYWCSAFFHAETIIKAKALGYRITEVEVSYVPRATGRATGARPAFILATLRDMLCYWVRLRVGERLGITKARRR
jgi:glycosyltransferase involved in cell wall biosynthesis